MALINEYKQVSITQMLGDLKKYKYDPTRIQTVGLNYLKYITDERVDVVDPTSPFAFLMELSAVNTALAISEGEDRTRKQYPALAIDYDDLYRHMSDKDYINRFAVPTKAKFKVVCDLVGLINSMVDDPANNCWKVVIPRDTWFEASGVPFRIVHPITILKHYNGGVRVEYDTSYPDSLFEINTVLIEHDYLTDGTNRKYLYFDVDTYQFNTESAYFTIEATHQFRKTIPFDKQFYHAKVFHRNNDTNNRWVELKTTHSEFVFDPKVPTVILKLLENNLVVEIPYVYVLEELIKGDIRIDILTTEGDIHLNMNFIGNDDFAPKYNIIDTERDASLYTAATQSVPLVVSSTDIASGGKDIKSFEELRSEVLDNAMGNFKLPISNQQMTNYLDDRGYILSKNIDIVTERYYIASKDLPLPTNETLITPAVLTAGSVLTTIDNLRLNPTFIQNTDMIIIPSKSLFKEEKGTLNFLNDNDIKNLDQLKVLAPHKLVSLLTDDNYYYTPYYYVLDFSNGYFDARAYDLDKPSITKLNFAYRSPTYNGVVNTLETKLTKTKEGYRLLIMTKADAIYNQENDNDLYIQLSFKPYKSTSRVFINGELIKKTTDGRRVFEFFIQTNHRLYEVEEQSLIELINFDLSSSDDVSSLSLLEQEFDLFYLSRNKPAKWSIDYPPELINTESTSLNAFIITHEKINLKFGCYLKYLWSKTRTFFYGNEYKTYKDDVPLLYEEDVYDVDAKTGSIFKFVEDNCEIEYLLKHRKGDPVFDSNGNPLYRYRKGDVILGPDGLPVRDEAKIQRLIDFTLVDACYLYANGKVYTDYHDEFTQLITDWVITDMVYYNELTLEKTEIYFYPRTTKGMIKVLVRDNIYDFIDAAQKLTIDFYVHRRVYNDPIALEAIRIKSIRLISQYFKNRRIAISDIIKQIKNEMSDVIVSLNITGLGGVNNYEVVTVETTDQLSIAKRSTLLDSGDFIVEENITTNFYIHELPL